MPIHVPGKRDRKNRGRGAARKVVAALSLTAMVDMFTVLVVFLLQNYNITGEIIDIPDEVVLPKATSVKELKPANVVVVSDKQILLNNDFVYTMQAVQDQKDWMISELKSKVQDMIAEGEKEKAKVKNKIIKAVAKSNLGEEATEKVDRFRKITIQADKGIDFLSVKKVMYTLTEAGIIEINFAVLKKEPQQESL